MIYCFGVIMLAIVFAGFIISNVAMARREK